MSKLRILIADDEPDALDILTHLINDSGKGEVVEAIDDALKIECAVQRSLPDVIFMDIEMPIVSGVKILENIREYNQEIPVVFITAYQKYTVDVINLNVFSYLLKPISRSELDKLLNKLICLKEQKIQSIITEKVKLPVKDGYLYFKPDELFSLEAEGNYTRIKTISGDEFVSSYNMGRLYKKLPEKNYYRINRHCIMNGDYIFKINKKQKSCMARLHDKEFEFNVSQAFITKFNQLN